MRVLMRKTDGSLCCLEVTKAHYDAEAMELTLENMEELVAIRDITLQNANAAIFKLYSEGMTDLSAYESDL